MVPFSSLDESMAIDRRARDPRSKLDRFDRVMKQPMSAATALILGAGFSHVAGLPLAKNLFDAEFLIPSREAKRSYEAVLREWRAWKSVHPIQGPEQFLSELYGTATTGPIPWAWAAELVAAILATPLPHDRGPYQARYGGRITRPVNVADHEAFWALACSRFRVTAVLTTNYDLLIERGLRHRPMRRTDRPGIYYGGLGRPQVLRGPPFRFLQPSLIASLSLRAPSRSTSFTVR